MNWEKDAEHSARQTLYIKEHSALAERDAVKQECVQDLRDDCFLGCISDATFGANF